MRKNNCGKLIFEWDDVIDIIITLSYSQGFYCRLLKDLEALRNYNEEAWNDFVIEIESQKFTSMLDVIMYFEG